MRNGRVRIDIEGVNRVVRALEYEGLVRDIGNTTEAYTRKMANESAGYAPVKTVGFEIQSLLVRKKLTKQRGSMVQT
ncbi:hypothetical protein QKW52_15525 [Bacillus sonorensis]|nr:hypothetical protein [Bacillus sonorensis]